jgi:hypothetical protein
MAHTAPQWNESQYQNSTQGLREHAELIKANTVLRNYPSALREAFLKSEFRSLAPGRIARIVQQALPLDKSSAMPSPELTALLSPIAQKLHELRVLANAARAFHIEEIKIPEDRIGLDLLFPRELFHNDMNQAIKFETAFIDAASYFIELATGSAGAPELVFTSTSELVIGVATVAGAAWGVLKFYDTLLGVALKQVQLFQTLKTLRSALPTHSGIGELDGPLKGVIETEVRAAVDKAIASVHTELKPARINEISSALGLLAPVLLEAIRGGARVSISIESLGTAMQITEQAHIQLETEFETSIVERKQLEHKLEAQLELFNRGEALLLEVKAKAEDQHPE